MKSLYMGEFNSEKFWRNKDLASLPAVIDDSSEAIVYAMDELLFTYCGKDDLLITKFSFDRNLKNYLNSINIDFNCSYYNYYDVKTNLDKTIFELIVNDKEKLNIFLNTSKNCMNFSPYSIVSCVDELAEKSGFKNHINSIDTVKKVNSKEYSTILNINLDFNDDLNSKIIKSSSELVEIGSSMLSENKLLIKDTFGVSGKGNLLIDSKKMLERIAKYINSQEKEGEKCIFVIENYLEKELDFSCGFIIKKDGSIRIECIQKMINRQFCYGASVAADDDLIEFLNKNDYFSIIKKIGKELYKDGYIGEVCVDSMILSSGKLIAVIEINARKSMGFINNEFDKYLSGSGLKGKLMNINLCIGKNLSFEDILIKLDDKNILFSKEREYGVVPLSSNTVFINKILERSNNNGYFKGRFYFSLVSRNVFESDDILKTFVLAFNELDCKVYTKL